MDVIPLLVFLSLLLGAAGVALFLWSVRLGDHEHADRLALLPLEEDAGTVRAKAPGAGAGRPNSAAGEAAEAQAGAEVDPVPPDPDGAGARGAHAPRGAASAPGEARAPEWGRRKPRGRGP